MEAVDISGGEGWTHPMRNTRRGPPFPAHRSGRMSIPQGVYAILATPFADDGNIDFASLDRLVDFELAAGVEGLTVLGIMGEAHKLTEYERERVVEAIVRRVNGRVPVVVGTSAPATDLAIRYSRKAQEQGATAVMVAPPTNLRN